MKMRPRVTVIITAYNIEQYIGRCLQSVLMQRGRFDCEVCIFEDASTDQTMKVIKETLAANPPPSFMTVKILPAPHNLGRQQNYNRFWDYLMKECHSDYVTVIDGDDWWTTPYRIYRHVRYHALHPKCPGSCCGVYLYDQSTDRYCLHPDQLALYYAGVKKFDAHLMARGNPTSTMGSCFYKLSALKKVSDDLLQFGWADWLLHFMISWQGALGYLPEPMIAYRLLEHSDSHGHEKPKGPSENILRIQDYVNHRFHDKYATDLKNFISTFYG